jgi:hypothetical protein
VTENNIDTSKFAEYQLYEPADIAGMSDRLYQNEQFRSGAITNPEFSYPLLNRDELEVSGLAYDSALATETDKAEIQRLEARRAGVAIALASLDLQEAATHTDRWFAGRDITARSFERYGEMKPEYFWPVVLKWQKVAESFKPGNMFAEVTQKRVLAWLPEVPEGVDMQPPIDHDTLDLVRGEVMTYMEPVLRDVPKEGEFSAEQTAVITQRALENTGLASEGWVVVVSDTAAIFSVRNSKKQVIVPNRHAASDEPRVFSGQELYRLLPHEIGVHAMRRDKSLGSDFEEGIGILVEAVVTNETDGVAIRRAEDRYLHTGLAAGLDGSLRNARQVFNITWRLEAMRRATDGIITPTIEAEAKATVQPFIDNIFRGTNHKLPGVAYTKAKVYLEGIMQAVEYAREHADEPDWLGQLVRNGRA